MYAQILTSIKKVVIGYAVRRLVIFSGSTAVDNCSQLYITIFV